MRGFKHKWIVFIALLIGILNTNTSIACNQINKANELKYSAKVETNFSTALRFDIGSINTVITSIKNSIFPIHKLNLKYHFSKKYKCLVRLFLMGDMQIYSALYLLNNVLRI